MLLVLVAEVITFTLGRPFVVWGPSGGSSSRQVSDDVHVAVRLRLSPHVHSCYDPGNVASVPASFPGSRGAANGLYD